MIRPARLSDAAAIAAIYNPYVLNTIVTFEEEPVTAGEIRRRMREVAAAKLPWLVAQEKGEVQGYAYASKWKGRCAYRYSVEVGVYVSAAHQGRGIGKRLYKKLIAALKRGGRHALLGGIALPNRASVALHESLGFTKVGRMKEVGYKLGRWIDVGYWEKLL